MKLFEINKWGPKRLRDIFESIEEAINRRTPLPSETIDIEERPDGLRIAARDAHSVGADNSDAPAGSDSGSSSSGSSRVIATEFINVANAGTDSDEILYSHEIGPNRLVTNGDSIRAVYGLTILSGGNKDIILSFGVNNLSAALIVDAEGFAFDSGTAAARIEASIMRTGSNTFRWTSSILLSGPDETEQLLLSSVNDGSISGFADEQFLALWGGAFGGSASAGQVTARMALIEYVPA